MPLHWFNVSSRWLMLVDASSNCERLAAIRLKAAVKKETRACSLLHLRHFCSIWNYTLPRFDSFSRTALRKDSGLCFARFTCGILGTNHMVHRRAVRRWNFQPSSLYVPYSKHFTVWARQDGERRFFSETKVWKQMSVNACSALKSLITKMMP